MTLLAKACSNLTDQPARLILTPRLTGRLIVDRNVVLTFNLQMVTL
jgi:hypothetical protein